MNANQQIISARWVIPVQPRATVLEHHAVVIERDKIVAILPTADAIKRYPDAEHTARPTHALIPGLINAHTHAAMSLFRGIADDVSLMTWLNDHIWPAEQRWVNPEFMRDGTELAIAEMLMSGTTCFNDMYFFPNIVANVAQELGIRAFVGMIVIDFPSAWASNHDEYFEKGLAVHDDARSLSLINTTLSPHAPYTVSDTALEQARTYADELNVPLHMHVHETSGEVSDSISNFGVRPLQRLHTLGMLIPRMMAVHMTQLSDDEIALTARQGISVVHCPESNLKLASGTCPVSDLLDAGTNVCLGTDSASSNNDLNMLGEIRSACLLAKSATGSAAVLPAWQGLELATINAAKALNVEQEIGSLEVGKMADIVAIDLNHLCTSPVYDPVAQIIYSASPEQVTDVWIGGKVRVKNRQLQGIDIDQLLLKTNQWGDRLKSS